jgi:hypothetical protein
VDEVILPSTTDQVGILTGRTPFDIAVMQIRLKLSGKASTKQDELEAAQAIKTEILAAA